MKATNNKTPEADNPFLSHSNKYHMNVKIHTALIRRSQKSALRHTIHSYKAMPKLDNEILIQQYFKTTNASTQLQQSLNIVINSLEKGSHHSVGGASPKPFKKSLLCANYFQKSIGQVRDNRRLPRLVSIQHYNANWDDAM